jgi:L-lactate permease
MAFKIRPFSLFKVQSVCLRKVGLWPGPENQALHRKHLARTALNLIITILVLVFELNFALNSTDNISAMIECLVSGITRIAVILKLAVYLLKHTKFKELLETFDKLVTDGELI